MARVGVRQLGQCLAEWRCEMREYAKCRWGKGRGMRLGMGYELRLGLGQTKGSKKSQLEREASERLNDLFLTGF